MKHYPRLWTGLIAGSALVWVFSLYLQPEFALLVANQLWMCF